MASLYIRKKTVRRKRVACSPYWWIKFRNPRSNKIEYECTGFLHSNGQDTRRAKELEAHKTLEERKVSSHVSNERWSVWVKPFIDSQYARKPNSRTRYNGAWRTLSIWLDEIDVTLPRQLAYHHCIAYTKWRETPDASVGKFKAGHNTAVLEMKFMALVMKQAVRLGYAQGNPCRELNLKRERVKVFPHYSDTDIQLIADAIHREPKIKREFLWPSFLIAYYHGVRLNETHINPMRDVSLGKTDQITFFQKGGKTRTKPLHPELRPLFESLQADKKTETFAKPKSFAKEWHKFLHRCGMKAINPNACFHSIRVTVQNRMRRAGIPKEIRKAYLSHDKKDDVNELYDRVELDEMLVCHAALNHTWKLDTHLNAHPQA